MLRIRPWVIGATFIGFGVVSHAVLKADPLPGRIEMGQFAGFEFLLYAVGLGLSLLSLISAPMSGARRASLAVLWLAAVVASLVAVIDSLPP
jgi:hypothetical protein